MLPERYFSMQRGGESIQEKKKKSYARGGCILLKTRLKGDDKREGETHAVLTHKKKLISALDEGQRKEPKNR